MPSLNTQAANNNQHQAFKYLRQVYPYLDMHLLATRTPWKEDKLATLFALWFPKRLSQNNNLLQHSSATCYLCNNKKKPSEALNVTCDSCFNLLLDKLNTHPMVYSNWNPHVEAIAIKRLATYQHPDQPEELTLPTGKPLLSQSQPVAWAAASGQSNQAVLHKNDDAHVWVQGWLNQAAAAPAQGGKANPSPSCAEACQQPLKKIGFVG